MSFDNVLANVQSGKADIAISGISATEERQKIFDFSDTYYESETVLVVKKRCDRNLQTNRWFC